MSLASAAMTAATTETCACPEALIPADHCLMIGRCTLALMLSSRFLGDMMFVPEEQRWVGRKKGWKKLRGGGVVRATLPSGWVHGRVWACSTQVRSTLGPHSAYSAWVSTTFCPILIYSPLFYYPASLPRHTCAHFFLSPPNCNSCCSSSVSRRDKLKEDSHMALSHLSRGPHESQ